MTLINIQHLTQKRKEYTLLSDVNLNVEKNKILGIIGDEGTGKTTLMEVLAGILYPTEGRVTLGGYDVVRDAKKAKSLIGYMPESMAFYGGMTIIEYLSFIAEAKGLSFAEAQKSVKSALSATDLLSGRDIVICKLNQVGKARLGLAQALVANPQILLLDCPTRNLTEKECESILKLIKTLSHSRTVIITSQSSKIASICDETVTLSPKQPDVDAKDVNTDGEMD